MPLIVKDYTWEETDSMVWITVPLKGVKANKVDITSCEQYLKVSYPPYLFECLLAAVVDCTKGSAQVGNGAVTFKLYKKEPVLWRTLRHPDADDKEIMKQKREEAQEELKKRLEEQQTKQAETKREHEKLAINEMMKLEEQERSRISNIKESERQKATEDLEKWKEEQQILAQKEKEKMLEAQREQVEAEKERDREERRRLRKARAGNIFEKEGKDGRAPPRENGKIVVKHTPRVFPTPVRESQTEQEEEWLRKQAEAKRSIELSMDADLKEEEKNPQWLQDKGNSFFTSGDYQAAINAYTHAIRMTPKLPSLYSNRAACHLKLRNFFKCIEDCSKAMDLLFPAVPQNASSRCKALVRRGTAFCQLELYVEGLRDYEAALQIDPNNKALAADAERMRHIIQATAEV
ncbi:dyslexia susceptibility 1 candidate gene 1 protein homolog [Plakobranchus ocellatus]|uniref:Dynein axonemal assembly factor 4 n=1 Tax=Plakobranchus ocellatus TaxID=259542 RepID=A0AAV3YMX3_9GAST|nr:dyslexia susceptibility 1 candidate gene 1 protein homolog [Plakobranchus ocellatus]